jgi:hypothetical protein
MKRSARFLLLICTVGLCSCKTKPKQTALTADFQLGKIKILHTEKEREYGQELTLLCRFELNKQQLNPELSNYFQYRLGRNIKLVIHDDTLNPVLDYYLPLIDPAVKEINAKFKIGKADADAPKRIIINDTILEFNKVNILFK